MCRAGLTTVHLVCFITTSFSFSCPTVGINLLLAPQGRTLSTEALRSGVVRAPPLTEGRALLLSEEVNATPLIGSPGLPLLVPAALLSGED